MQHQTPEVEKPSPENGAPDTPERRSHPRLRYARELPALHSDASDVLLGRDLSMTGIRIERGPSLRVGREVAIALYGARREEPLVLEAEVLRQDRDGFGLRFASLSEKQKSQLERLLERLPALESLVGDAPGGNRLVVSKLVRRGN